MKSFFKRVLPDVVVSFSARIQQLLIMVNCNYSDMIVFLRNSSILNETANQKKLSARISMSFHGIEKGLTMPDRRLGFGKATVLRTIKLCKIYIKNNYDLNNDQFLHALAVIDEYYKLHKENSFKLDFQLEKEITFMLGLGISYSPVNQMRKKREDYFADTNSSFDKFSSSRRSIRSLEKGVKLQILEKAVTLAQNAPSSCNRQSSRVHIIENNEIINKVLKFHQGNRGFGHLSDKLIFVTAELGVYASYRERNSPYIDAGMFGMNLLYSLHFYKIGACTLNCYFTPKVERIIRKLCKIPKSEVFVMLILVGNATKEIPIALSKRKKTSDILNVI